jgi:DNA gyrase subunit B
VTFTAKTEGMRVVEGLGAVRLRPGLYVKGATPEERMHQLVLLAVHDAARGATAVATTLHAGSAVAIVDDGPGLPVAAVGGSARRPQLDYLFMTLPHGPAERARPAGPILNALSERLLVRTVSEGVDHRAVFSRGAYLTLLQELGPSEKVGSRVVFRPDPQIFGDEPIDPGQVARLFAGLPSSHPEVEFALRFSDDEPDWY